MNNRANFSISWILCATLFVLPATMRGQSAAQTASRESHRSADKNPFIRMLNNGAWWNTLSSDSKSDFVDGYVSAMATVHQMLIGLITQDTKEVTHGPTFDSQMSRITQLSVIAERYDFQVGQTKLLAGMDAFYKEPLNKLIPIDYAFLYQRDALNGKVAPRDLQKQLDEWRAVMNK
jgi:hypothetical protein